MGKAPELDVLTSFTSSFLQYFNIKFLLLLFSKTDGASDIVTNVSPSHPVPITSWSIHQLEPTIRKTTPSQIRTLFKMDKTPES